MSYPYVYLLVVAWAAVSPEESRGLEPDVSSLRTLPDQPRATTTGTSPNFHIASTNALHSTESMQGTTSETTNSTMQDSAVTPHSDLPPLHCEEHDSPEACEDRRIQDPRNNPNGTTQLYLSANAAQMPATTCPTGPQWSTSATAQLQELRLRHQGWEPMWLAVLKRIVHRDPGYETWCSGDIASTTSTRSP